MERYRIPNYMGDPRVGVATRPRNLSIWSRGFRNRFSGAPSERTPRCRRRLG